MSLNVRQTEDGFVYVNGVNLHYVRQGEGPLVILLHGFPEFWYSWRHQLPYLSSRFCALAPDMRGYNLSDKPRGVSAYFMDELMGDVKGLIKAFGEEKAIIIAHDWGGVIAWNLVAYFPDVVERLVVLNAPHPVAFVRELRRNPKQRKSSRYVFMFQVPWLPEWYVRRGDFRMLDRVFSGWVRRKESFTPEDVRKFKDAMGQAGCLTAAINYYRAGLRDLSGFKRLKHFPKIDVPTLIIWGDRDRALTNELTYDLEPYFSVKPQVRYVHDCSHWVQQEQPQVVNEMLGAFLFREADGE